METIQHNVLPVVQNRLFNSKNQLYRVNFIAQMYVNGYCKLFTVT